MKRKLGIFINIALIFLCIGSITAGVFSIREASLNINGTLNFVAHDCLVNVKASIEGYSSSSTYSSTSDLITSDSGVVIGGKPSTYTWNIGTLVFDDINRNGNKTVNDIVFTFEITNLSAFYVDFSFNRDCINSSAVRVYNPNQGATLAPAYVRGSGYEQGDTVKFSFALQLMKKEDGSYSEVTESNILKSGTLINFYRSDAPAYLITDFMTTAKTVAGENTISSLEYTNTLPNSLQETTGVSLSSTSGKTEAGTDITSPSEVNAYFDNSTSKLIIYSKARIYAPVNCKSAFSGGLTYQIIFNNFDTSLTTSMSLMFQGYKYTSIDVSNFDTSQVVWLNNLFESSTKLTEIDLSNFNTSKTTEMQCMFNYCSYLAKIDVSNFDTSNVTSMGNMFNYCGRGNTMQSLDLSSFNTQNVESMKNMFSYITTLTKLNISNFNTENVIDMKDMFLESTKLTTIYVGNEWTTSKITEAQSMFSGCKLLVGGSGTACDGSTNITSDFAKIDGGTSNPGYFTKKPYNYVIY